MNLSSDHTFKSGRYAFEPFGTLDGVLRGDPFKIFPQGKWYRGNRELNITKERLVEFAANVKSGLPRFRIPINENHAGVGKVGTISEVEYMEQGPDGPGLYATRYEFTDEGKKLIEQKRFDAVSGEAVWTLFDDAKYQDPTTGKTHDNVLVGVALTNKPFFGHDQVALFTAAVLRQAQDEPKPKRGNGYTKFRETMRAKFEELMAMLGDEEMPEKEEKKMGDDMPEKHNAVLTVDSNPPLTGVITMTQSIPTPETFSVKKEEFEALKAQAAEAAKLKEQFAALQTQSETFAAKLAEAEKANIEQKRARRLDQLKAEKFTAIPDKQETLAEKFLILEEKDPELFKYFNDLLHTLDTQITQSMLFSQIATPRTGGVEVETFEAYTEQVLTDKFSGDRAKYEQAMNLAATLRPDLFATYNETYAPARK